MWTNWKKKYEYIKAEYDQEVAYRDHLITTEDARFQSVREELQAEIKTLKKRHHLDKVKYGILVDKFSKLADRHIELVEKYRALKESADG